MKSEIRLKPRSLDLTSILRLKTEAIEAAIWITALFISLGVAAQGQQTRDYTRYVNPFIGTGGHGHTFPGATMPFGMVQLSPDTRIDNWDGSSGYHYSDDIIYGFSHTHLSGTGIPDGCDILFMPTIGMNKIFGVVFEARNPNGYVARFSHENERAEPGYYSVKINDTNILAELTATQRVGFHRYTYPDAGEANVVVDLGWRDKTKASYLKAVGKNRIEGYRESSSWAKKQTVYFVAEFSKPLGDYGSNSPPSDKPNYEYAITTNFKFTVAKSEPILVKVAISFVSIEGARKNLETELPGWDFDKVRADARAAWNNELSKIEVSGGTPEQTTNFYTALYHTMIHPNVFNDVDGKYLGHDGKIHQLPWNADALNRNADAPVRNEREARRATDAASGVGGRGRPRSEHYTVFSLWDTFRAAHPLYTIIDQKRTVDFINSFIRIYEQGGRLPVWELWGEETDTMIGYHAVSVIADAMAKDIKGFDYEKAYAAAKHSAELDHFGLAAYKRRGYISMEDENESVSRTLEYAYNDWCIMSMASTLYNMKTLGRAGGARPQDAAYLKQLEGDIDRYRRRAGNFENLFDPAKGFFRPKRNGGFVEPFAPNEVTFGFTEGNSWQYSFFVPHDVERLMQLMGGREKFVNKLDELFTTSQKLAGREQADLTGLIGQYAHGNEPSHHIAYLYNYAGRPSKAQKYVRRIMDEFYNNRPDGLIGNEDCGQMSAWYVLSASGFYPVVPGEKRYDIGTPLFNEINYRLENGKRFTVRAPKVSSSNIYINSAKWNGKPHVASYITQDHILAGGVLELEMSDQPNDAAFSSYSSSTVYRDEPAVPIISGERTFADRVEVKLSTISSNAELYYVVEAGANSEFRFRDALVLYARPIVLTETSTIRALARRRNGAHSLWTEAVFRKRPNDWTASVISGYSTQYTGGGDQGIIDGIRGTTNFASGEWQGIQGKPYEAVVDLQRETSINKVGAGFLQVAGPWIWMPVNITFDISNNGSDWSEVADIKTDVAVNDMKPQTRDYVRAITPVRARYVRVRAFNFGKIPAWHPGAGGDPWIFIDEVLINQ